MPPEDRAGDLSGDGSKPVLRDGDTIPLRNTAPADNVEDLLRSVSNLVSGGAIGTLQSTVVNVNKAFPKDPAELTRIQRTLGGVLNDLAANQDTIDGILSSMENITTNLAANTGVFNRLVTEGPPKLEGLSAITVAILNVVGDSKDIGGLGGEILNPITGDVMQMLSYITPMIGTIATVDTTIPVLADKLIAFLHYKLLGWFRPGRTEIHCVRTSSTERTRGRGSRRQIRRGGQGDAEHGDAATMKFNAGITLAILAVLTLLGAAYMAVGVLDISPTKQVTRLTLMLDSSGGLMSTSEVTMRGIKVGRVTGIETTTTGLAVSLERRP